MDALAALVLAKALTLSAPARFPAASRLRGSTIACTAVEKPAMRRCAGIRGVHLFECVNLSSGEVTGGVLTGPGYVQCGVSGSVSTTLDGDTCATVTLCGQTSTACLSDPATLGRLRCLGLV